VKLPRGRRLVLLNDAAVAGACTVNADDEHEHHHEALLPQLVVRGSTLTG
jgi:hypothetical protein